MRLCRTDTPYSIQRLGGMSERMMSGAMILLSCVVIEVDV